MTAFRKTSPVGVDKKIDGMQRYMENHLPDTWGVSSITCLFYGRAELLDEKNIWYTSGIDYVQLGFDDRYNFVSYFVVDAKSEYNNGRFSNKGFLYCHGKLDQLYSDVTHSADEELRQDVLNIIYRFHDTGRILGSEKINDLKHPKHSFRIELEILYR